VITKQGAGAVVVMKVETVADLAAQVAKPRSLADMFPVTEFDPPVEPLKLTRKPGFRRIAF
jgi:hypothetical protein